MVCGWCTRHRDVVYKEGGVMAPVRIIDAKRKCAHFQEVH